MRFMILVKASADSEAGVMPSKEKLEEMLAFHEELAEAGVLLDASGLRPTSDGWRVRYSRGERIVTDGPFTESKELLAGYTLIRTETREEAVEWVRRFPSPAEGDAECEIEVRRLFEMEDFE